MAEFQEILDFPPAPKLDVFGKLDPTKATATEMRGQEIFVGKGHRRKRKTWWRSSAPYRGYSNKVLKMPQIGKLNMRRLRSDP
jgi:hypothetical protein